MFIPKFALMIELTNVSKISQSYMEDDNGLPADEINFHLDNIIDPPNDDGEMNLIKLSPYFGIDCLPHSLVHTRDQLNILIINAQSLNSKYDELVLLLNDAHCQNIRFHVICVQETWLSETSGYSLMAIHGYNCIHLSQRAECSNHGGLITHVDNRYDLRLNKRLSKQSWGWWFETLSRPLWRHCNVYANSIPLLKWCFTQCSEVMLITDDDKGSSWQFNSSMEGWVLTYLFDITSNCW